jgi:RNA recognition motif-containing protein
MSSNRVYVGNLSWSTSWQDLKDHMRDAGEVQYAKVLQDRDGRSKGCGIVEFTTPEGAQDAISKLTDTELKGRKIFVREDREDGGAGGGGGDKEGGGGEGAPPRAPRTDGGGRGRGEGRGRGGRGEGRGGGRGGGGEGGGAKTAPSAPKTESSADEEGAAAAADASPPVEGSQLFVGNLSWETGWRDLKDHFLTIGAEVERADVAVGRDGRKKGFGFVRYGNAEDAAKAIEELNGVEFMGRPLEVRLDNKA